MQDRKAKTDAYAEALLALGQATGKLNRVAADLASILELISRSEGLRRFVSDPLVTTPGKKAALQEILAADIDAVTLHSILILQESDRLAELPEIAKSFFAKVALLDQRLSGELVSAVPIPAGKLAVIESEAGRILGKKVSLRVRVDSDMLGGLRLQVGDIVIDGTVDRQMELIQQSLLA